MSRANVLSGQVFGKVDWVTSDSREFGMFVRTSQRESSRVVVSGPEAERLLANGVIQKGMMAEAHGTFYARAQKRHDTGAYMGELVCDAQSVLAEAHRDDRFRSSIYGNMKAVVMYWDPSSAQLKTFFNYTEPGRPKQMTCSLHMKSWLDGMSAESQERFKASLRVGREFTAQALIEVSCYRNRDGDHVPSLMLLPTHFSLQG